MAEQPGLSVILVSAGPLETLAVPLPGLQASTIASQIELVIVAERGSIGHEEIAGIDGLHSVRLVESDTPIVSRGRHAAAAVPAVRAPYFALHENHVRLSPESYERLLAAHNGRTAAVAPAMCSANPEDLVGLAMYAIAYADYSPQSDRAPRASLPHHNSVFATGIVRSLPGSLADWFEDESTLQAELIARGFELRLVPDAEAWHINESRPRRLATDGWQIGRRFGYARSREWPLARKMFYAALLPVITAMTWLRLVRASLLADENDRPLAASAWATGGAFAFAFGEVRGYFDRSPPSSRNFEMHELHVHGRLNGRLPAALWLRDAIAALPPGTP